MFLLLHVKGAPASIMSKSLAGGCILNVAVSVISVKKEKWTDITAFFLRNAIFYKLRKKYIFLKRYTVRNEKIRSIIFLEEEFSQAENFLSGIVVNTKKKSRPF